MIANTIFPIFIYTGTRPDYGPQPLALYLVRFVYDGFEDALINVAVLVPLGVLIPLLTARPSSAKVIAIVAAASLTIELAQMVVSELTSRGHLADINDRMTNVLGGVPGYGLFVLVTQPRRVIGFVQRFRWPAREGASLPST